MSAIWFECKVKYRKMDDTGVQKVTTEPYLVDALSYTEAEMEHLITLAGEFYDREMERYEQA